MKIGVVGLGKLGLPIAEAMAAKGHEVIGNDINLANIPFRQASLERLVGWSDLLFVIVQTPHQPKYDGSVPLPPGRADFDYSYLRDAVKKLANRARRQERVIRVVVVSTCLPGTFEREIQPLLNEYIDYIYSPLFPAMGTVAEDFYSAEFNLIGHGDNPKGAALLKDFYATINDAESIVTDIATAEAIKVSYNTFVTMKTVLGNIWGEIAHKMGLNFEDIWKAWSLSNKRLLSDRYLAAGMGDGGACHPRDNIALSWLAQNLGLSYDFFGSLMMARQAHTKWLARVAVNEAAKHGLPLVILGRGFKPETDIVAGSPSILLHNIIMEKWPDADVEIAEDMEFERPAAVFIGTANERYRRYQFPEGSVIIDPFRYMPDQEGVEVIRIGEKHGRSS